MFVTTDQGLEYEQNQQALPLAVIVLLVKDNKLATLESLVPSLLLALRDPPPKMLIKIRQPGEG